MPPVARLRGAAIGTYLAVGPQITRGWHRLGRSLARAPHRVVFYHQVDDPWSHLLAQALPQFVTSTAIDLTVEVIGSPPADTNPDPVRRQIHGKRDAQLLAGYYTLEMPSGEPTPERVARANAILLEERKGDETLDAVLAVGAALWRADDDAMGKAEARFGTANTSEVESRLAANYERLRSAGHYQGGMLSYGGEWYWGVDRLPLLQKRLRADGVEVALPQRRDPPLLPVPSEPHTLEFFFSFRSPYSYLAVERTLELAEKFSLDLKIRPVLPMVMRGLPVPKIKRLFLVKDAKREADWRGIPFGRICDPLGAGVERCLAVFPYADQRDLGGAFLRSAGRGIWSEALDVAADTDLRTVVERAGLDWQGALQALDDPGWREQAAQNREALLSYDLWGVPSYRLGDQCLWGQDRIEILEAMLTGLR